MSREPVGANQLAQVVDHAFESALLSAGRDRVVEDRLHVVNLLGISGGSYLRWMFFGAGCVDSALIDRMLARPTPEKSSALGYGRYEDVIETLEKAITPGPYLLHERFSAADVYIGSQIGFGMMTKTLEPRPLFQSYLERLSQRPAYKRFQEQSEKLMAMKAAV